MFGVSTEQNVDADAGGLLICHILRRVFTDTSAVKGGGRITGDSSKTYHNVPENFEVGLTKIHYLSV